MRPRIGILTGGGDVQSLNALIASAADAARSLNIELRGFVRGWEGVIRGDSVDLTARLIPPGIGGTILKSSRLNLQKIERGAERAVERLKGHRLSGLIAVGGEDTLANTLLTGLFPQVFISKTIDNDVGRIGDPGREFRSGDVVNYFTLGYPTAAQKIAEFVSLRDGLRTTAYSHERIIVVEAMGMHAGWLALAAGMGDPDMIIIPEFPLEEEALLGRVMEIYEREKHVIIVVAEGARLLNGRPLHAAPDESPDFGHPRFGGAAEALKIRLKKGLADHIPKRNINAVNPSYLYRSGPPNPLDARWARNLGREAVRILAAGLAGTSFLTVEKSLRGFRARPLSLEDVKSNEGLHRFVDGRFYDPGKFCLTGTAKKYLKEMVEEIPRDRSYGIGL